MVSSRVSLTRHVGEFLGAGDAEQVPALAATGSPRLVPGQGCLQVVLVATSGTRVLP